MLEALLSVVLLIIFLVPGYVWYTVEAQFVYQDQQLQWEKFALKLLARSAIFDVFLVHVIYGAWLEGPWSDKWSPSYFLQYTTFIIFIAFLFPAACGFFLGASNAIRLDALYSSTKVERIWI